MCTESSPIINSKSTKFCNHSNPHTPTHRPCPPTGVAAENVMFDMRMQRAILIDYDCSTEYNPERPPTDKSGTDGYMAPEVLSRGTAYDCKVGHVALQIPHTIMPFNILA